MRCPKCGYITFDRVERCGKCAHDLMAVAAQLRGPMAKVAPPMFLNAVLRAGATEAAEDEPATIDLEEEALDLGEVGEEIQAMTLEEETPVAEEEMEIEMPSLSGIDVSDLLPEEEEAVELSPATEALPEEEEIGGIAMPEVLVAEAEAEAEAETPAAAAGDSDDDLSLNFDLTGGEARGGAIPDEEEEAGGGVLDLADLLGTLPEVPAAEEPAAATSGADELHLDEELDLTLDGGEASAPAADAAEEAAPAIIPDLGLTLESDDEDEKPAA